MSETNLVYWDLIAQVRLLAYLGPRRDEVRGLTSKGVDCGRVWKGVTTTSEEEVRDLEVRVSLKRDGKYLREGAEETEKKDGPGPVKVSDSPLFTFREPGPVPSFFHT